MSVNTITNRFSDIMTFCASKDPRVGRVLGLFDGECPFVLELTYTRRCSCCIFARNSDMFDGKILKLSVKVETLSSMNRLKAAKGELVLPELDGESWRRWSLRSLARGLDSRES